MKVKIGEIEKVIPKKYAVLGDLSLYIMEPKKKRLQPDEREVLDRALAWKITSTALFSTSDGRFALQELGKEIPVKAVKVKLRNKTEYYVLKTASGKEVRCSVKAYNQFPKKEEIFRNY